MRTFPVLVLDDSFVRSSCHGLNVLGPELEKRIAALIQSKPVPKKKDDKYPESKLDNLYTVLKSAEKCLKTEELVEIFGPCFASTLVGKLRKHVESKGGKLVKSAKGYSITSPSA